MDILLGDSLRHQEHIRVQFHGFPNEVFVLHLSAQIVSFYHLIALQSIVSGESLSVHDSIDTHSMRIGTGGSAYKNQLPTEMLPDEVIDLLHGHNMISNGFDFDMLVVYRVNTGTIDYIKSKTVIQFLRKGYVRFVKPHLLGQLPGSLHSSFIVFDRQSKAQLHLAVVHGIAIGFELGKIQCAVEVMAAHIVQSTAHCTASLSSINSGKGL